MIHYACDHMRAAGIQDIVTVCPALHFSHVRDFVPTNVSVISEHRPRGAVAALALTEPWIGEAETIVVGMVDCFTTFNAPKRLASTPRESMVIVAQVNDVRDYGAARLDEVSHTVLDVVEKPERRSSDWAVIGWYKYPQDMFERIWNLPREDELSISDLNKNYCNDGGLSFVRVQDGEDWCDAGTHEGLAKAEGIIENDSSDR